MNGNRNSLSTASSDVGGAPELSQINAQFAEELNRLENLAHGIGVKMRQIHDPIVDPEAVKQRNDGASPTIDDPCMTIRLREKVLALRASISSLESSYDLLLKIV